MVIDLDAIVATVMQKRRRKPAAQTIDLEAIIASVVPRQQRGMAKVAVLERLALSRAQFFGPTALRGMDLFAGAGGFTIGALAAHCPMIGVEYSQRAVQTGRAAGHDVLHMDVREAARRAPTALRMDVMIGGPPCQPFSSAGKRRGKYDPREGFGLALEAIDAWRPRRVVLENVSAFLSSEHRTYREKILAAMRDRFAHAGYWLLNARDFGVPQDRERVFIWGAEVPLEPPVPSYGPGTGRPYVTIRQALSHLMDEGLEYLLAFQSGATSRTIDRPSPTITAVRNLYAVSELGMTYRGAGSIPARKRRILYPQEIQALQAFPGTFGVLGTMAERASQIGNAVPPPLGAAVMTAVAAGLVPRRITPTELLDSFQQLDESIWVYEPRPWTDAALIGVTTNAPQAPGALVPVYDGSKLKNATITAHQTWVAQQRGTSIQGLSQTQRQDAFIGAMDYLSADKQSRRNPAAPIVVPTRTLAELGLPIATMLLPQKEKEAAFVNALEPGVLQQYPKLRRAPKAQRQDAALQWLAQTLADNDEIIEF